MILRDTDIATIEDQWGAVPQAPWRVHPDGPGSILTAEPNKRIEVMLDVRHFGWDPHEEDAVQYGKLVEAIAAAPQVIADLIETIRELRQVWTARYAKIDGVWCLIGLRPQHGEPVEFSEVPPDVYRRFWFGEAGVGIHAVAAAVASGRSDFEVTI